MLIRGIKMTDVKSDPIKMLESLKKIRLSVANGQDVIMLSSIFKENSDPTQNLALDIAIDDASILIGFDLYKDSSVDVNTFVSSLADVGHNMLTSNDFKIFENEFVEENHQVAFDEARSFLEHFGICAEENEGKVIALAALEVIGSKMVEFKNAPITETPVTMTDYNQAIHDVVVNKPN